MYIDNIRKIPDKRILALASDIEKGVRILICRWNFGACWDALHFSRPINLSKLTVTDKMRLLGEVKSGNRMPSYSYVQRYILKLRAEGERRGLFKKETFPE